VWSTILPLLLLAGVGKPMLTKSPTEALPPLLLLLLPSMKGWTPLEPLLLLPLEGLLLLLLLLPAAALTTAARVDLERFGEGRLVSAVCAISRPVAQDFWISDAVRVYWYLSVGSVDFFKT
jgi:hypothetical protein